jgi:pilus assembly protein CpaF
VQRAEIYGRTLRHFLKPIAHLLYDNESITEILVNGSNNVYYERGGRLFKDDATFPDEDSLWAAARNLAEFVDRRLDDDHHSMDGRLPEPDRFRVHVIAPPCSRQGVCLSIRKFKKSVASIEWLIEMGSLDPVSAEFLSLAVRMHNNILVAGGTNTGKTSMLNALSAAIPSDERIIVIEDTAELQLQQPHTVYLESRPPRPDGGGAVTIRDLFVDSLRMRPDRIVVGEVRRGEALDLVQSMLSGHDGSLATVHASTPLATLTRLETLCMMSDVGLPVYVARQQIASAVHLVVQAARVEGVRCVREISQVRGLDGRDQYVVEPLFRWRSTPKQSADGPRRGRLEPTGAEWMFARDAIDAGLHSTLRHARHLFEKQAGA